MTKFRDLFTEYYKSSKISAFHIDNLKKAQKKINYSLHHKFNGPLQKIDFFNLLVMIEKQSVMGKNHILFSNFIKDYGKSDSDNIILPYLDLKNNTITDLLLLNHPKDCQRIAEKHVKKMPNFVLLLHDSIISTTSIQHWKNQRADLINAFTPESLNKILPISQNRAKKCGELLWKLSKKGSVKVNMSDFFLNETLAQLQLAMFGFSEKFQQKHNKKLRDAFGGNAEKGAVRSFAHKFMSEIHYDKGPLAAMLDKRNPDSDTELYGNALIFNFAGHDTTGHTLTWLLYELCQNQTYQKKLQREVDMFWSCQKENKITTNDFKRLPFMTRCIMETLRLWNPVPNGTFRELIEDEIIEGKNGQVNIPKGTYVQIWNYGRHHNKELWGEDVNDFNPLREFYNSEVWENEGYAFYNPYSERFSPFTYTPRDCIGKNFAHMEMRLILLYLIKDYHFILTENQNKNLLNTYGSNVATMGPIDIENPINKHNKGFRPNNIGMYVMVMPRNIKSSL